MLSDIKYFKQQTKYTCGPASIMMAASCYRYVRFKESSIAKMAKTNKEVGTTIYQMAKTAKALKFKTNVKYRGDMEHLERQIKANKPTIVIYKTGKKSWHYSVVVKITAKKVTLADPWTDSLVNMKRDNFEKNWKSKRKKSWCMTLNEN